MKDIHIVRHTAQSRGLLLELSRREGLWTLLVLNNCFQMTVDYSLPVSSIRGSLWARILEWVAMSSSRGSSQPRDQNCVSCWAGGFLSTEPLGNFPLFIHLRNRLALQMTYVNFYFAFIHQRKNKGLLFHKCVNLGNE